MRIRAIPFLGGQVSRLAVKLAIWISIVLACFGLVTGCTTEASLTYKPSLFDQVISRGRLRCGTNGELPGFSFLDPQGRYVGLDVDICRAIAAALFDNPNAVDYRSLNAKERFAVLQSGEIDILSRNTTVTLGRAFANGLDFAPVVFYDGQGIMVRQDSQISTLEDLKGKTICTQVGTTTQINLADQFRQRNIPYQPLTFDDINTVFASYESGRCQAVSADKSALIVRRSRLSQPSAHVILPETISKEPLAPAIVAGDSRWLKAISWVIYTLFEAEDLGISSTNLAQIQAGQNELLQKFLRPSDALGDNAGLPPDFPTRIIRAVGNYAEIYQRHLGSDSQFRLPRANNSLWKDGGLLYSPPFR
jgi:general L-amino acid transport system substrate-binding protein